jgi:eukaryotic-like serine/threonine-protein kinase
MPPRQPPPHEQPETNTLATLSLVFAVVFAPAGAVLGHLGLSQIARTGQRGRDRALIGITLSYVVILIAVVTLVVWAVSGTGAPSTTAGPAPTTSAAPVTTTSAAPATTTPVEAPIKFDGGTLPAVLLPLDTLQQVGDDPGLTQLYTAEGLVEPRPEFGSYSDTSCLGSYLRGTSYGFGANLPLRYVGTDAININPGRQAGKQIRQGAAAFASDAKAQKAFDDYVAMWRTCAGQSTQFTPNSGPVATYAYGTPDELAPGIMAVRATSPESSAEEFVHVVTVKANVLIDNTFAGLQLGNTALDVTRAMLDRVPN